VAFVSSTFKWALDAAERIGSPRLAAAAYQPLTVSSPPMPLPLAFALVAVLGALIAAAGFAVLRLIGAQLRLARRLAGARELSVSEILSLPSAPPRPVRVRGRVRTSDPISSADGEPLVALHRDVAVWQVGSGWRTIERLRLTRSFELWDHAGSLSVDPGAAAEPLVTIPLVWEGSTEELGETHSAAVARLARGDGQPARARAVTRTIGVADTVLVLAEVRIGNEGVASLAPPIGGYIISSLPLDEGMRVLGGRRRALLAAALIGLVGGSAIALVGALGAAALAFFVKS
jgi:hypothetical protein